MRRWNRCQDTERAETRIFRIKRKTQYTNALDVGTSRIALFNVATRMRCPRTWCSNTSMHVDICVCSRVYMRAYACARSFPSYRVLIMVKAAGSALYIRHPACLALLIMEIWEMSHICASGRLFLYLRLFLFLLFLKILEYYSIAESLKQSVGAVAHLQKLIVL